MPNEDDGPSPRPPATAGRMPASNPPHGEDASPQDHADSGVPLFRVVSGDPTPAEVAALTVALSVATRQRAALAAHPSSPPTGGWSDRSSLLRAPLIPGPGAWRRSHYPR